jgi:hypothetical protein
MKLTKQNKLYLGIAALGVVGYLIWKQTQTKKQEFLGLGKRRKPKTPPTQYYIVMERYPICDKFDCGGGLLGDYNNYFEKGDIVYGNIIGLTKNGRTYLQQPYTENKLISQIGGGFGMNINSGTKKLALIPMGILKPSIKPTKIPSYVVNIKG